jgi:hypothetical protein
MYRASVLANTLFTIPILAEMMDQAVRYTYVLQRMILINHHELAGNREGNKVKTYRRPPLLDCSHYPFKVFAQALQASRVEQQPALTGCIAGGARARWTGVSRGNCLVLSESVNIGRCETKMSVGYRCCRGGHCPPVDGCGPLRKASSEVVPNARGFFALLELRRRSTGVSRVSVCASFEEPWWVYGDARIIQPAYS